MDPQQPQTVRVNVRGFGPMDVPVGSDDEMGAYIERELAKRPPPFTPPPLVPQGGGTGRGGGAGPLARTAGGGPGPGQGPVVHSARSPMGALGVVLPTATAIATGGLSVPAQMALQGGQQFIESGGDLGAAAYGAATAGLPGALAKTGTGLQSLIRYEGAAGREAVRRKAADIILDAAGSDPGMRQAPADYLLREGRAVFTRPNYRAVRADIRAAATGAKPPMSLIEGEVARNARGLLRAGIKQQIGTKAASLTETGLLSRTLFSPRMRSRFATGLYNGASALDEAGVLVGEPLRAWLLSQYLNDPPPREPPPMLSPSGR